MSIQTLLHHILMLSYKDKVFISEQLNNLLQTENLSDEALRLADCRQNNSISPAMQTTEGYISLEEFRKEGHKIVHKFCIENGIN
jgi:hypothetical protein